MQGKSFLPAETGGKVAYSGSPVKDLTGSLDMSQYRGSHAGLSCPPSPAGTLQIAAFGLPLLLFRNPLWLVSKVVLGYFGLQVTENIFQSSGNINLKFVELVGWLI